MAFLLDIVGKSLSSLLRSIILPFRTAQLNVCESDAVLYFPQSVCNMRGPQRDSTQVPKNTKYTTVRMYNTVSLQYRIQYFVYSIFSMIICVYNIKLLE